MLTIRPEQMEVFNPMADEAFAKRVAEHVRENHADVVVQLPAGSLSVKDLHSDTLLRIVRRGIARAREYDLETETSLAGFVVIMFVAAPNFDEHPLIRHALMNEEVEADERLEKLWGGTSEENWEVVRQNYDSHSWGVEPSEKS